MILNDFSRGPVPGLEILSTRLLSGFFYATTLSGWSQVLHIPFSPRFEAQGSGLNVISSVPPVAIPSSSREHFRVYWKWYC